MLLPLASFNQLFLQGICAEMSVVQFILLTFHTNHHWNLSVCSGKSHLDHRSVLPCTALQNCIWQ